MAIQNSATKPIADDQTAPRSRLTTVVRALLIACCLVVLYGESLDAPFVLDDIHTLVENPKIRHILPVTHLFAPQPESAITGRPIVGLTFALNNALDPIVASPEWRPTSWRACNLFFHLLNALLLQAIIARTLQRIGRVRPTGAAIIAFAIALVWAVHPLHIDSIVYISQRTVLMMSMFLLLTLYCAIRSWDESTTPRWRVVAVACCAFGMMCKESMAIAPVIVFLYDRSFISTTFAGALKHHWRLHASLAATWVIAALIVMSGPRTDTTGGGHGITPWEYLLTQSEVIALYFKLAFWPVGLSIHHEFAPVHTVADALPIGLITGLVFVIALTALWRWARLGFLLMCVFIALAPTSSIVPIVTEVAAERRMYLPTAAITSIVVGFILIVLGALPKMNAQHRRYIALGVCIALAIPLALATQARTRIYESRESLWRDALAAYPDSPKILNNLAVAVTEQGRPAEAIPYFERSLDLEVDERTLTSAAVAYAMLNNFDRAESLLLHALDMNPELAKAHDNLGNIYLRRQNIEKALEHLQFAADQLVTSADAQYRLAMALALSGDRKKARLYLQRALQLRPHWPDAQALLDQVQ